MKITLFFILVVLALASGCASKGNSFKSDELQNSTGATKANPSSPEIERRINPIANDF